MNIARIRNTALGAAVLLSTTCAGAMTPEEIVTALKRPEKESKMIPIIEREKSLLKALEIYNRY